MTTATKDALTKLPVQFRAFDCEITRRAAADGAEADDDVFDVAFSSEFPVERWYGTETLSHDKSAIDMAHAKRGLPFLLEHGGDRRHLGIIDPDSQVGIVEDITLGDDRKLRGKLRFSKRARAQEIKQDYRDGIRKGLSFGYQTLKVKQTKVAEKFGEKSEYLVTRWMPVEVTGTCIPADPTVGVGRSQGGDEFPVEIEVDPVPLEERTMDPITTPPAGSAPAAATPVAPAPAPVAVVTRDYAAEAAQISELCVTHGVANRTAEFIRAGSTPDQVGRLILEGLAKPATVTPAAEALGGMPKRDRKRYSVRKAIAMQLAVREGTGKYVGLEGEVHAELQKRMSPGFQSRSGVLVPLTLDFEGERAHSERTMASNVAGKGAELVFDQPGELIELLRAKSVAGQMGARMLTGLTGPVVFPRQTAAVTVSWRGENSGAVGKTDPATGDIKLTQKTLMGATALSRQLIHTASFDSEGMVRDDLSIGTALAIDRGAFHGTGTLDQPTGIYSLPGVLSVDMSTAIPTYVKLLNMIGAVADQNADFGTLGFITTALMAARLKGVQEFPTEGSRAVWTGNLRDGDVAGYRAVGSTQLSKTLGDGTHHGLIFGNWNDLVIGMWDAIELLVDPYTQAGEALVNITSFQMADIIARHPESFCKAINATIV